MRDQDQANFQDARTNDFEQSCYPCGSLLGHLHRESRSERPLCTFKETLRIDRSNTFTPINPLRPPKRQGGKVHFHVSCCLLFEYIGLSFLQRQSTQFVFPQIKLSPICYRGLDREPCTSCTGDESLILCVSIEIRDTECITFEGVARIVNSHEQIKLSRRVEVSRPSRKVLEG